MLRFAQIKEIYLSLLYFCISFSLFFNVKHNSLFIYFKICIILSPCNNVFLPFHLSFDYFLVVFFFYIKKNKDAFLKNITYQTIFFLIFSNKKSIVNTNEMSSSNFWQNSSLSLKKKKIHKNCVKKFNSTKLFNFFLLFF